jgi:hypothetical protein
MDERICKHKKIRVSHQSGSKSRRGQEPRAVGQSWFLVQVSRCTAGDLDALPADNVAKKYSDLQESIDTYEFYRGEEWGHSYISTRSGQSRQVDRVAPCFSVTDP